jgi:ABC-2 type transport system permease protein
MKDFLKSKFISGVVPLILISETLVIVTNLILKSSIIIIVLSSLTILFMTLAIGGLGVGLGAMYPKFRYTNIASIPMGLGGILFMILALTVVTLTVLLEAWPMYLYLNNRVINIPLRTWEMVQTGMSLMLVIIINLICFYVPMRLGTRSIEGEQWM